MSNRRAVPAIIASAFALLFFGLGNYLGARQTADSDALAAMRSEIAQLKRRALEPAGTTGRSADPVSTAVTDTARASIVADVKRQLTDEMGLLPLNLLGAKFHADYILSGIWSDKAAERGLGQLKGHRSVGGMRASIYNAMPLAGVRALVDDMRDFEHRHG